MKHLKRIRASFFRTVSQEWMWDNLFGPFVIVFDDGEELLTNARECQYSGFGWEYHRAYPDTPLLKKHHIRHHLGDNLLTADTHLDLFAACLWSVYDAYALPNYMSRVPPTPENPSPFPIPEIKFREQLSKKAYELTNYLYNETSYRLEEYVGSLDITDFMKVLANKRVAEVNDNLEETEASISNAYREVRKALRTEPDLINNPLSRAARSKTIKEDQLMQCVSARGFVDDTDSFVFPVPIKRGFARGLRSLHDVMVESRSASKSLAFSKTELQDSEYFSRRLQLVAQIVQNLHMADCGSTQYMNWTVRPEIVENGRVRRDSDLVYIKGKYYMDDDGIIKTVRASDRHLIGRTLKLRTVLRCAHHDSYGVCSTCFGDLSYSVPAKSNLGHMCCTHLTQKISQSVLSLKHINMSSELEGIVLDQYSKRFVKPAVDQNSFLLAPGLKTADKVVLVITPGQAPGLTDVLEVEDVTILPILRVSELSSITVVVTKGTVTEPATIEVRNKNRDASLTYEMLDYAKVFGWATDANGNYEIDMSNWNWDIPILKLPRKQFNMSDHAAAIARMLESTVKESDERDLSTDPLTFLSEFHDLVTDKLMVNLAVNEVVVLGISIRSAKNYDYRLPKPGTDYGLGVRSNIFAFRSMGHWMPFQNQRDAFLSPLSYVVEQRPDGILDGILMPYEVAQAENGQ